jgi:hypothetical protein
MDSKTVKSNDVAKNKTTVSYELHLGGGTLLSLSSQDAFIEIETD